MKRSEVYSWRISSERKSELEEAARRKQQSVAKLLESIVDEWLRSSQNGSDDSGEQERIRRNAARAFGRIRGGDPARSARARETVRARLRERRGR